MDYYYGYLVNETQAVLTPEDSVHCTRVMRKSNGQRLQFTDGKGHLYHGIISNIDKIVHLEVTEKESIPPLPYTLDLVIAPTKNISRIESLVEKATEFGINSIKAIWTHRSERKKIREDRLKKIALSAMKQSKKVYLPEIKASSKFTDHIASSDLKFIAHCNEEFERQNLAKIIQAQHHIEILIGPEGDFDTEEIEWAHAQGYQSVHLGPHRLRTETAGLFIAALCYQKYLLDYIR